MEIFNIWDLERVNIKLKEGFLDYINKSIFSSYKSKVDAYKNLFPNKEIPWISFKNMLKKSYMKTFFVPLDIYLIICDKLKIDKNILQENIISYKTAGGVNYIDKPILPIKITPVFHMLFAHNIGDGTVINPKKGRLPYFGYRQFDKFYRVGYIRKIEDIFGKINFKENYFESSTRPYCPSSLSSLFFKYYNLDVKGFDSLSSRIPKFVLEKDKDSLLAIMIAFIIDEGNIDSTQITIVLKNKSLVEDLGLICKYLDYDYKITYRDNEFYKEYGYLNILRKGMKKLYKDYLVLNKKYSVIDLGWKGERIKNSLKIYNREIFKVKGNQNIIFEMLKKEELSVNQLANRINMTRQGIRYHINNLIKDDKIKLIDNMQINWIYGV